MIEVERIDFVSVPARRRPRPPVLRRRARASGEPAQPDEFETPNVTLTLWEPEAEDVAFSPNTAGIALRVPDVAAARARLAAEGVEFLGDVGDTGVCHTGFFRDPDGNVLILHRRYAPRA